MRRQTSGKIGLAYLLIILLFVVLAIAPKIVCARYEVYDAFSFSPLILSDSYLNNYEISTLPFEDAEVGSVQQHANSLADRPGAPVLLATISAISGLGLDSLLVIPINGLIMTILVLAVAKRIIGSTALAALAALAIGFIPGLNSVTNTVSCIGWGFSLFLTFAVLALLAAQRTSCRTRVVIPVLVTFLASYLIYYTTEIWIISFMSFSALAVYFYRRREGTLSGTMVRATIVMIIFFVAMDAVFYSYVWGESVSNSVGFFGEYLDQIFGRLQGETPLGSSEYYAESIIPGILRYIFILTATIPIVIYILSNLMKGKNSSKGAGSQVKNATIVVPCLGVCFVDIFAYASMDALDLKSVVLLFPLLALFSAENLAGKAQLKWLKSALLAIALILITSSQFVVQSVDQSSNYLSEHSELAELTIQWTVDEIPDANVLTDLRTAGQLALRLSELDRVNEISAIYFDNKSISILYGSADSNGEALNARWNYLIVLDTYQTKPIECGGWFTAKPVGDEMDENLDVEYLSKLYSDGSGAIYGTM